MLPLITKCKRKYYGYKTIDISAVSPIWDMTFLRRKCLFSKADINKYLFNTTILQRY